VLRALGDRAGLLLDGGQELLPAADGASCADS
jgi:hypothetical protein